VPQPQVLVVLVAIALGAAGGADVGGSGGPLAGPRGFWLACLGPLTGAGLAWIGLPLAIRALDRRASMAAIGAGLRLGWLSRWVATLPYAAWAGLADGLGAVRAMLGDWVGVDEAVAALPPLVALLAITAAEQPLHRRLAEARLVRDLDGPGPLSPAWGERSAVAHAARGMLALPLIPVLALVCWHELTGPLRAGGAPGPVGEGLWLAGAAAIVALAPAAVVRILPTRPVGPGPLRERVRAIGRLVGAHVRGVRLWSLPAANAAIVGPIAATRCLLVTDRLLADLDGPRLDAVLAHELAHVRLHHVLWLALSVGAAAAAALALADAAAVALVRVGLPEAAAVGVALAAALALAAGAFGFVSRRAEHQADAHAAAAVGRLYAMAEGAEGPADAADGKDPAHTGVIHPGGVAAMAAALESVSRLNGVSPRRWGFRHGSIRQRQRLLASVVGGRPGRLPVDRVLRRVRLATVLVLVLAGVAAIAGSGAAGTWLSH